MTTSAEINRSLNNKKIDSFYVSFFGMDYNDANILGRQVQSFERPVINFNITENRFKGLKYEQTTRIEYQALSIVFYDDDSSLVSRALIEQVKKQSRVNATETEPTSFQIGVKCYNAEEKVVEQFELSHCYIQNITNSELIQTDGTVNLITVTVSFNDVNYSFPILEDFGTIYLVDHLGNLIVDHQGNPIIG